MEHISNLMNVSSLSVKKEEKEAMAAINPHVSEVVNNMFLIFWGICRGFDKQYTDPKRLTIEKSEYILAFTDAGFDSMEKISHGLKKCREITPVYTPRIGEFIGWCTPSAQESGFPDYRQAFQISLMMNQKYSDYVHEDEKIDTVIRHALTQIGSGIYRAMTEAKALETFAHYYAIACKQFLEGKIKPIDKALPHTAEPHPDDKARADKAREECFESLKKLGLNIRRAKIDDPR